MDFRRSLPEIRCLSPVSSAPGRLFANAARLAIMKSMKRLALLLCCPALLAFGADLAGVKNVYVLKMSRGMDQYLANRLTNEHLFQIVTDPKLADAILTDQIGDSFQAKLNELYPPPPPPQPEQKPEKEEKSDKADKKKAGDELDAMAMFSEASNKLAPVTSSFGRSKGTLFLVDAKSKEVVWSTYDPPKDSTSRQLDRTANDIVSRLKRALQKKER